MKRKLTPQEKKVLSYQNDSRGSGYAKNLKSGRKSVKRRKADVNRSYRKAINQSLVRRDISIEEMEFSATDVVRKSWRKFSDPRMIDHFENVWSGSSRILAKGQPNRSVLQRLAKQRLRKNR